MQKNKVVIINYYILRVGGIEKFVCRLIPFMLDHGVRVIWLKQRDNAIGKSFEKVLKDERLENVIVKNPHSQWFRHGKINLSKNDEIIILSFTVTGMAKSLEIVREHPNFDITPYYYIPNTTGDEYYVERYFHGWVRKTVKNKMASIYKRWDSYGSLRFFASLQINSLEENYNFVINNKENKTLKPFLTTDTLDMRNLQERIKTRTNHFTIITVGRFDFPHKGYMLGLVRSYARLKDKYPNLNLVIIGYGPDEKILLKEIESIEFQKQKDITLIGETSPNELKQYFANAHLNISVAGAVGDGARYGVISLPARNYCYGECEVYGLDFDKRITVSRESGYKVEPYIEKVLNMTDEEYKDESVKAYNRFCVKGCPWYVFDVQQETKQMPILMSEIIFIRIVELAKRVLIVGRMVGNQLKKIFHV